MAGETMQYKRTVKGSVGAGIGALFNGSGRQYFILQHRDETKFHHAGESQKIIVDQVELGRAKECQVQFDGETCPTVSRRHAAIEKDVNGWKIVPLSQTNSTLVNGRVISSAWYLQNGDEIQLSKGGPRLGFIVPAGPQSLVSSIKLTERLNLFRQQALRPYKAAIGVLSGVLVLGLCVGGFFLWKQGDELRKQNKVLAEYQSLVNSLEAVADSLKEQIIKVEDDNKKLVTKANNINSRVRIITADLSEEADIKAIKSTYIVRIESIKITFPNGAFKVLTPNDCPTLFGTGTGFLLEDGRFVTARHVIESHKFIHSQEQGDIILLNTLECLGADVETTFGAYSSEHSFKFTNKECHINRSDDQVGRLDTDYNDDGEQDLVCIANLNNTDWAYINTSFKGSLKVCKDVENTIKKNVKLRVYGYPGGYEVDHHTAISGSCVVAKNGLDNGLIIVTERNFEHGNSGGPVLAVNPDGSAVVVGLISSGYGDTVGHIVSISNVK